MATMDGSSVAVGDAVYDTIYSDGEVFEITLDNRIKVRFPDGREMTYTTAGVSVRFGARTLYWKDPVIAVPLKTDTKWDQARDLCTAIVGVLRA